MSKSVSSDHATTDSLSENAHHSVNQIAKNAGKAEERIRNGADDAQAHISEAGQKAKERSSKTVESISGFVRDNPLTSLSLVFAAGTLFSALRRRS